jgi:hypothetical protein
MSEAVSTTLLWLFVINLGIAFGAGVYEHRIVVSRWLRVSPDSGTHWDAEAARRLVAERESLQTQAYWVPGRDGADILKRTLFSHGNRAFECAVGTVALHARLARRVQDIVSLHQQ